MSTESKYPQEVQKLQPNEETGKSIGVSHEVIEYS